MQQEQQRREIARRLMTSEAYERLMNVRLSNRELYTQLLNLIIQMAQGNRIAGKLTEEQLRSLLSRLTYKPEPTVQFKHK
jgi:programmed cell death protein 5